MKDLLLAFEKRGLRLVTFDRDCARVAGL